MEFPWCHVSTNCGPGPQRDVVRRPSPGEPLTDRPSIACPVITAFFFMTNDASECDTQQTLSRCRTISSGRLMGIRESAPGFARTPASAICLRGWYPKPRSRQSFPLIQKSKSIPFVINPLSPMLNVNY
jgi:hypothetical protein